MPNDYDVPPFTVNETIVNLVSRISERVGSISVTAGMDASPHLRRENRIRTIHSSLAIESNTLSLEQVSAIIEGKRVLGPPGEIAEVQNAFEAYEKLLSFDPYSIPDLLRAHRILMNALVKEAGVFRSGNVGVFGEGRLIHMAPPAGRVPELIARLLLWTERSPAHPLIKSCVFHYEFEFIHPFADGNGRMGRMWQTLLLYRWKKIFAWLPVETLIKERQGEYYHAINASTQNADSAPFIEFSLRAISDAFDELSEAAVADAQVSAPVDAQVSVLLAALGRDTLSARELMARVGLKHRQNFQRRYLRPALEQKAIEMTAPDKPNSSRQRYRRAAQAPPEM